MPVADSRGRRIGVVVAMPTEARCLARRAVPAGTGLALDAGVTLLCAGIGVARARGAARELVRSGAQGLVSWGTAAALDPSLEVGELLLPERIEGVDETDIAVDRHWHRALGRVLQARVPYRRGRLAHARSVLRDPKDKRLLFDRTAALGADMESAGVAAVARDAGVAFLSVRAVSDRAEDRVPSAALGGVGEDGRIRTWQFLASWLSHLGETPAVVGLAKGYWSACRTLARVADAAGPRLGLR